MVVEVKAIRTTIDENGTVEICLAVPNKNGIEEVKELLTKGKVECELRKKVKKRSLDANAYCWVLCEKIAEELKTTREQIYRNFIERVGVFVIVPIKTEAVKDYTQRWESNGIGWFCQNLGASKLANYNNVMTFFGSSTYTSKEMARLIEEIISEAKELGIETKTPSEIAQMMSLWRTNEKHFTKK